MRHCFIQQTLWNHYNWTSYLIKRAKNILFELRIVYFNHNYVSPVIITSASPFWITLPSMEYDIVYKLYITSYIKVPKTSHGSDLGVFKTYILNSTSKYQELGALYVFANLELQNLINGWNVYLMIVIRCFREKQRYVTYVTGT